MDHATDYIRDYLEFDLNNLVIEYKSEEYKKISECPSYSKVNAYCKAYNILLKEDYGIDYKTSYSINPTKLVKEKINN